MRKIFVFIMYLITIPAMALDDACTKPKAFTIDKRCYVTSTQKNQQPFNTTVALIDRWGDIYCTGTIVKGYHGYNNNNTATEQEKNIFYVYTAKHCTDLNKDGKSDTYLNIMLQTGKIYKIKFARAGQYKTVPDTNFTGDYALYTLNITPLAKQDISFTTISDKWASWGLNQLDARVIGYGALKIMSDAEIKTFKDKYIKFLKSQKQDQDFGILDDGVNLDKTNSLAESFLDSLDNDYYNLLFRDDRNLKVSNCKYHKNGETIGCQTWGGNSGGGIFDNTNRLLGILTRGNRMIGSTYHAGKETEVSTAPILSIPIAF